MIASYPEYKAYLKADRIALRRANKSFKKSIKEIFYPDLIWKFQKSLRRYEYLKNTSDNSFFKKFLFIMALMTYRRMSVKLGFSIPANVFGPGLSIAHYGTIVINRNVKVGANCRIHVCVNIGSTGGNQEAPVLGDNVYIGPGAKIFGDILISSNMVIGANSVVNKSFPESNCIIAGSPAEIIKKITDPELKKYIPHMDT